MSNVRDGALRRQNRVLIWIDGHIPSRVIEFFLTGWMHGQRIGYVRVSSFDQNPERQIEHVQVDRLFTDEASGKDTRRPELETGKVARFRARGRHGGDAQHGPAGAQSRRPYVAFARSYSRTSTSAGRFHSIDRARIIGSVSGR